MKRSLGVGYAAVGKHAEFPSFCDNSLNLD
jgi:hypothetical protein